jgi:hypothetical protein
MRSRRRRISGVVALILLLVAIAAALAGGGGGLDRESEAAGGVERSRGGGAVGGAERGGRRERRPAGTATASACPSQWPIRWRRSRAVGLPYDGRLVRGVKLPCEGRDFFTWDPILQRSPNRWWRRFGTTFLLRKVLRIARAFRESHGAAPRLTIGDLSRPRGGDFGIRFGPPGHASHQNGFDVDIYYPRLDRAELAPVTVAQIDLRLSQQLVNRFVAAGAEYVFVGPSTGLGGPPGIVQALTHHDNHLHVRFHNPSG